MFTAQNFTGKSNPFLIKLWYKRSLRHKELKISGKKWNI